MDNTVHVLLKDRIKLEPRFLAKKYNLEVLKRLKDKVEGKCSKHGYIKENSIEIYKIAPGMIETASLNGIAIFEVYFYADICNPSIGSIVKGVVKNINRFGILIESPPILDIIVAKNSVNIQSEIDLEDIKIEQELLIEIIGKKYELGDKRISIVGRVIKDTVVKKLPSALSPENEESEDEDIIAEPELDEEEAEAEEEVEAEEEEEIEAEIEVEADAEAEGSVAGGSANDFNIFNDEDEDGNEYEIFDSSDDGEDYENDD